MTADQALRSSPRPRTGAIDQAVIEQLRVDLEDEDGSALASLVGIYLDSSQTLIPDLAAALRSGDTDAAARFAHALSSATTLVGAGPLAILLQRIQDVAHDAGVQPAQLAALADTVTGEGARVAATLGRLGSSAGRSRTGLSDQVA